MTWISENWQTVGQRAWQGGGLAALGATLTPTESDNKVVDKISKLVHALGANFGKAKNGGK